MIETGNCFLKVLRTKSKENSISKIKIIFVFSAKESESLSKHKEFEYFKNKSIKYSEYSIFFPKKIINFSLNFVSISF